MIVKFSYMNQSKKHTKLIICWYLCIYRAISEVISELIVPVFHRQGKFFWNVDIWIHLTCWNKWIYRKQEFQVPIILLSEFKIPQITDMILENTRLSKKEIVPKNGCETWVMTLFQNFQKWRNQPKLLIPMDNFQMGAEQRVPTLQISEPWIPLSTFPPKPNQLGHEKNLMGI